MLTFIQVQFYSNSLKCPVTPPSSKKQQHKKTLHKITHTKYINNTAQPKQNKTTHKINTKQHYTQLKTTLNNNKNKTKQNSLKQQHEATSTFRI